MNFTISQILVHVAKRDRYYFSLVHAIYFSDVYYALICYFPMLSCMEWIILYNSWKSPPVILIVYSML